MKKIVFVFFALFLIGCGQTMPKEIIDNPNEIVNEPDIDYDSYLLLVNKDNPISDSEIPTDLKRIELPGYRDVLVLADVADAYKEFYLSTTYNYMLFSGFRTIEYQAALYQNSGFNNDLVAKPYESEHHTGLAIDVSIAGIGLEADFGDTEEGIYLKDNIHNYGFIIRYEEGKKEITGYDYEPWHIRYIGIKHATYIYENNITLEEYLNKK